MMAGKQVQPVVLQGESVRLALLCERA